MTLRLLAHQLRGDLAALWPLGLGWCLILVHAVLLRVGIELPGLGLAGLLPRFQWLVLALLAGAVVLRHPFNDPDAFWLTRPIDRRTLLLAKTLLVAGLLVGPGLVAQLLALLRAGSPSPAASLLPTLGGLLLGALSGAAIAGACRGAAQLVLACVLLPSGFLVSTLPIRLPWVPHPALAGLRSSIGDPYAEGPSRDGDPYGVLGDPAWIAVAAVGLLALACALRYLGTARRYLALAAGGLLLAGVHHLYLQTSAVVRLRPALEVKPAASPIPGWLHLAAEVTVEESGRSDLAINEVWLSIERADGTPVATDLQLAQVDYTGAEGSRTLFASLAPPEAIAPHEEVALRFVVRGSALGRERISELPLRPGGGGRERPTARYEIRSVVTLGQQVIVRIEESHIGRQRELLLSRKITHPELGELHTPGQQSHRERLSPAPLLFRPPHSSRHLETRTFPLQRSRPSGEPGPTGGHRTEAASWSTALEVPVTRRQLLRASLVLGEVPVLGRFEEEIVVESRLGDWVDCPEEDPGE